MPGDQDKPLNNDYLNAARQCTREAAWLRQDAYTNLTGNPAANETPGPVRGQESNARFSEGIALEGYRYCMEKKGKGASR